MKKYFITIVKEFPRVSETFIYRELSMLCKYGYHPIIFSMFVPQKEPVLNTVDAFPDIEVRYVKPFDPKAPDEMKFLMRKLKKKYSEELINHLAYISAEDYKNGRGKRKFITCYTAYRILENLEIVNPQDYHIHSQFLDQPAEAAYIIHKVAGVNYSISCHARDIYTSTVENIKKVVGDCIALKTCTEYNARYLKSIVDDPSKIRMVYHGVDCDFFSPNQEAEPLKLLSVARFVEKKGYPYIFEALSMLKEIYPNFVYTIIGHGKLEEECRNLIQSFHLEDRVVIIPYASKSIVRYYLKNSEIFINASVIADDEDRDGIPNSVAEAMSMGLPVVATGVSGIPELVIHKETGYLVTQKDAKSLFEGILFFINHPEERIDIAANGMDYVKKHFHSQMMVDDCLGFYEEVLNK